VTSTRERLTVQRRNAQGSWKFVVLAIPFLFVTTPLAAHHAFSSEFDEKKPVKLKGSVVKMEFTNPHAWIYIDVNGPDGKVVRWSIECGAPNALLRRGFTPRSLPPGTEIIVTGYRAKNGSPRANGEDLTYADGRTLFLGSPGEGPGSGVR